jgi:hypothetical protein
MPNSTIPFLDIDEDVEDASIMDDIGDFSKLLHILDQRKNAADAALPYKADVITVAVPGPLHLPAHRLILAVRCPALGNILRDGHSLNDKSSGIEVSLASAGSISKIQISGCHPLTLQDIPVMFVPADRPQIHRDSPKLSPPGLMRPHRITSLSSPAKAVPRETTDSGPSTDELFAMGEVLSPDLPVPAVSEPSGPVAVWKLCPSTPRYASSYLSPEVLC